MYSPQRYKTVEIDMYWETEWRSWLRPWLRSALPPVRTSVTGGIFLRASHSLEREATGIADTYGCPLENSAKHKNVFFRPFPTVPKTLQLMALVAGRKTNKKKKVCTIMHLGANVRFISYLIYYLLISTSFY